VTKDELIDKHRYWNVEDTNWYEPTYECFKADMTAIGIDVGRMYFSGFCSQGDGACFEGRVEDWDLFLRSLGYTDKVLIQHAVDHFRFSVKHSGHYYHENCTSFSTDLCTPRGYYEAAMENFAERYTPYPWDTDDIRTKAWLALLNQYDSTKLEDEFEEAFKDHMIQLYKNLEKEHDYLTSDEVVWESLEANEMTDELEETNA
jgi:hypothetical protein